MWDSLQLQDQRGDKILDWILNIDLHILNDSSLSWTSRIAGNDGTPDIFLCRSNWSAKTSWRLAEPINSSNHLPILIKINHKICYQSVILRAARWKHNGIDWSCFTNEIKLKMNNLSDEPNFVHLVSMTFWSLLYQSTLGKQNLARNLNFRWLHMCKLKSVLKITSVGQSIKTNRSGSMLDMRLPRLSMRPRQKVGKISLKMQCWIQMAQICGKSSKIWRVLLMPTLQTKQCPKTVEPSLTSNPKPTYS